MCEPFSIAGRNRHTPRMIMYRFGMMSFQ